jgi:hypothetical protein
MASADQPVVSPFGSVVGSGGAPKIKKAKTLLREGKIDAL